MQKEICKYGTNRVIEPKQTLPQAAMKICNNMDIYDNEILIDVISLNIDSASFTQLKNETGKDPKRLTSRILEIVEEKGKMQNPVTGSGGMLIGRIAKIGPLLADRDLAVGDKIATLVSLSLTPLKIDEITAIHMDIDRVDIKGQAILFETGIYAKLPTDMTENLALAALDVAGAPAQTKRLVKEGNAVLILGAAGKSGMMCCYEAKKAAGASGNVVGLVNSEEDRQRLMQTGFCDDVLLSDVTIPADVMQKAMLANNNMEYDISINCVNVPNCEMSSILPVKDGGLVYFFSMAVNFAKAALGAEGIGKDVDMMIGNGYSKGHVDITLNALRQSPVLRKIFEEKYI